MGTVVAFLLLIIVLIVVFSSLSNRIRKNESVIRILGNELKALQTRLRNQNLSIPGDTSPPVAESPEIIKTEVSSEELPPETPFTPDEAAAPSIQGTQEFRKKEQEQDKPKTNLPPRSVASRTSSTASMEKPSRGNIPPKPVKKKKSAALVKLEKLFIENWIGIIGSLVLVIGVTFLGIYTAVKMNEIVRFLLITGIAVALFVLYLVLKRKEFWRDLALWLRSASAAVLLFTCLGAGFLPGLRFISSPVAALVVLTAGIAVNILLAFLSASELFAGLHTLFSMAVLAAVPQEPALIIFAGIIAGCGIIITYWQKWQFHLLLTISLYFGYTLFWIFSNRPLGQSVTLVAIIVTLLVHVPAILIHYHKMYSGSKFSPKLFTIHILNWLFIAVSLVLLSSGNKWKAFLILAASLPVFILARRAKRLKIRWLYVTDSLIGQTIAYAAIITFSAFKLDTSLILVFMIIETFIFASLMVLEKERKLLVFGQTCLQLLGLVFGGVIMYNYIETRDVNALRQAFLLLLPVNSNFLFSLLPGKNGLELNGNKAKGTKPLLQTVLLAATIIFSIALLFLQRIPASGLPVNIPAYIWVLALTLFAFVRPAGISENMDNFFRYLYLTLALIGTCVLDNYIADMQPAWTGAIVILQILLFTFIHLKARRQPLFRTGNVLLTITVLVFSALSLLTVWWETQYSMTTMLVLDCAVLLLLLFFHYYFQSKQETKKENFFFQGLFIGSLVPAVIRQLVLEMSGSVVAAGFAVCGILAALYIIRSRFKSQGIGFGVLAYSLLLFFLTWAWSVERLHNSGAILLSATPFLFLTIVFCIFSGNFEFGGKKTALPAPGIYLGVLQIAVTVFFVMRPVSPLVTGPAWLILSVLLLEAAFGVRKLTENSLFRQGKADLHLIISGYLLIAAFIVRHIGVHLQSSAVLFGLVRYRFLIEALAILVFIYWYTREAEKGKTVYAFYDHLKSLFFELIVISVGGIILLEIPRHFQPPAWVLAAFVWFLLGQSKSEKLNRLRFTALLFFWAAAIHIPLITARYKTARIAGFDLDWILALAAIVLQFGFLVFFHRRGQIKDLIVPKAVRPLARITQAISRRINLWVYYPLFVSIALFIIWSFSKNVLTVALMVETLMVFVLSVILRENHFRYLASAGILACLAKLFFVDLRKLDTIVKAVVFIAVAGILILINAIYAKYKDRFKVKNEK